jgi:hypothetical protein
MNSPLLKPPDSYAHTTMILIEPLLWFALAACILQVPKLLSYCVAAYLVVVGSLKLAIMLFGG